ncbi:MAG TPA: aldo/keto reductase [Dongiaceae bacterium]|jgi:aryl-alcohol dehydrogenase-like predicted oxidoreductase|nr:aldo/keto reductase [Dongiaceae bacterium]
MQPRPFGRTGWQVNPVGFGAWAIGADWGQVSERDAEAALNAALDNGVNFIDTADVYGMGRSEKTIAKVLKSRGGPSGSNGKDIIVATKAGRKLNPHVAAGYTVKAITGFIEQSLKNLEVDALDLLQLHCPPTPVYADAELFAGLERLVQAGKLKYYGVSVQTVDEAITAMQFPIASIQIIFNMFRQKPIEKLFDLAKKNRVAIVARVPLASGLLTGKMKPDTQFGKDDHRNYNRHGEAFDVGETFSGVDYATALKAVDKLRPIVPKGTPMAAFALRWILMHDAVTVAIPGAKNAGQAAANAAAGELSPLSAEQMAAVRKVYDDYIRPLVHQRW